VPNIEITLVMTSYNQGGFLSTAVEYLSKSSFLPRMELLIVDDCSTKDFDLVEHAARNAVVSGFGHVSLLRHQKNCGASAARNSGFEHALGKYVCFHDGDDLWEDDWQGAVQQLEQERLLLLGTGERVLSAQADVSTMSSSHDEEARKISPPRFPLHRPERHGSRMTFLVSRTMTVRHRSVLTRPTPLAQKPLGWEDALFWLEACAEAGSASAVRGTNKIRRLRRMPSTSWWDQSGLGLRVIPLIRPDLFTLAAVAEARCVSKDAQSILAMSEWEFLGPYVTTSVI